MSQDDTTLSKSRAATEEQALNSLRQKITKLERSLAKERSQRQELEKLAYQSPVTDMPNRRFFDEALRQRLNSKDSAGRPFCLILLDLNHFKPVNDTVGYETGDKVLRIFGKKLKQQVRTHKSKTRQQDIAAHLTTHWGGDEFAVILEGVGTDKEAEIVIKRLSRDTVVSEADIAELKNLKPVTASFGFACCKAAMSGQELFNLASEDLHRTKKSRS